MEIRFQPALLQEVVDSFSEKTEREGDPTYYNEFHEFADSANPNLKNCISIYLPSGVLPTFSGILLMNSLK
jgi:hypothetical protein